MNRTETIRLLAVLRAVWEDKKITEDTITGYQWALEDMSYEDAETAAKAWIRTGNFFPRPAELRRIMANDSANPSEIAETAWTEVLKEARRVGYNRPPTFHAGRFLESPKPTFSSELIRQAVESVGWSRICTGNIDEVRKDFIFGYRNIRERAVSQVQRGDVGTVTALPTVPAITREVS